MRIVIDTDLCQGHGVCEGEAPDVFEVDDHGQMRVLQPEPHPAAHGEVREAARYCPTKAITLVDA